MHMQPIHKILFSSSTLVRRHDCLCVLLCTMLLLLWNKWLMLKSQSVKTMEIMYPQQPGGHINTNNGSVYLWLVQQTHRQRERNFRQWLALSVYHWCVWMCVCLGCASVYVCIRRNWDPQWSLKANQAKITASLHSDVCYIVSHTMVSHILCCKISLLTILERLVFFLWIFFCT